MLQWLFGKKKDPQPAPQKEKKKKKSQAEQQTQDRWQYQFIVQFLNSPLWRVSILDFVDQNCVVFDNQEVNKFQYTKIHNQFKELVGCLFDGMMQEVGLDEQKLVYLLQKGFQSKQKKLFNQLLLCDDFLKFKQLMVKRNRALQEEAIKALNGQPRKGTVVDKQRKIIHSSIKEEQDRQRKIQERQQQELRKALQLSRLESQQKKHIEKLQQKADTFQKNKQKQQQQQKIKAQLLKSERERLAFIQAQRQRARLQQHRARIQQQQRNQRQLEQKKRQEQQQERKAQKLKNSKSKGLSDLPPLKNPARRQTIETQNKPVIEEPKTEQVKQQSKGETVQQRKKRLLEQRQKIRKKKQQQRKKMLDEQQSQNKKVMNIVLQDQGIHDSVHPAVQHPEQKISKDQIQRRKELMKKIKNRIVDDF